MCIRDRPIGDVGNPNVKNEDFSMFPNPLDGVLFIQTQNSIADIYILPGTKEDIYEDENFEERFESFQYSSEDIVKPTTFGLTFDTLVQNLQLNLSDFPTGYYRVFINETQGGDFQWENIYIDKENPYPTMIDSLVSDWK